jgi:hypothetical protein
MELDGPDGWKYSVSPTQSHTRGENYWFGDWNDKVTCSFAAFHHKGLCASEMRRLAWNRFFPC